jgi:hypothetical protein
VARHGVIAASIAACLACSATARADPSQDFLNRPVPAQCGELSKPWLERQAKAATFREAVKKRASAKDFCQLLADLTTAEVDLFRAVHANSTVCSVSRRAVAKATAEFIKFERYWKNWCDKGLPLRCGTDVDCDLSDRG